MATREGSTRTSHTFACQRDATRSLVVCIDGTSNQFGTKNTNIVELYSYITKSDDQLTYYSSGLGTIAKIAGSSHQLSNNLDMAVGRNLHKVIMASYRWLSDNYKDGDRIYLFGFSRGAYQVRALAGMISRVGLLLPGNNEQIPFAFELYSKTDDDDPTITRPASIVNRPVTKESKKTIKYTELAKTFQRTFCRSNVHIHFVGVWDTVSSVGLSRGKTLPCTTTPCEHICFFRHALALDERRVKFLPEYVCGGRSTSNDDGRIKEVWFAGCHGDVGGGNRGNEKLRSGDIPLLWMRNQAIIAGLKMEPTDVVWKIDDLNKQITSSLNLLWWLVELLPLKRLLYYNSDRHTFRPHFGAPRRIVPGQKVHVSVLFKDNYKPFAHFYNNPQKWPEPMYWNDATSHQRLRSLSDLWEKDIFDERSVQMLLDDLGRGQPKLDLLDRLAFMASFDACKEAISNYNDARQILVGFLRSKDRLIRLSTAATFCELGWDWPLETTYEPHQLIVDVTEILSGNSDPHCVCLYMPSLCKRADLKEGLISDGNLRKLVKLCGSGPIAKDKERTSTAAFYSAKALSVLMKLDDELAQPLIAIDPVTDITVALRSNCNPVRVSLLTVLDGLAKHKKGREAMRAGPTLHTLLKLVKQFDDFVAPAATRVLCSLLPEDDLRDKMLQFDVLSIFLDMLDRCSDETKRVTCQALVQFGQHDNTRRALSEDGHLRELAERVHSQVPSKRDGGTLALVALGNTEGLESVKTAVTEAIKAANTIQVLVDRLRHKSTALPAAWTLASLVKIDDVAAMVSDETTGACVGIVGMLQRRWFDGMCGEDGLQVLSELLNCEPLRSAVLKAGAIGVLRDMIGGEHYESAHAGLHYLRVVARFDKGESALPSCEETLGLVPPIVSALRFPQRRVQRIAIPTLRCLSAKEELHIPIIDNLLGLLKDRRAAVLFAASTVLGLLATDGSVRNKVLVEEAFLGLSHEYHNGLTLEYDEKGRGPGTGEVYDSVGHLIKLVQVSDRGDNANAITGGGTQDEKAGGQERERWPIRVPYELEKENRPSAYWIATLVCCPALLLCGVGRRVSRELWQEG